MEEVGIESRFAADNAMDEAVVTRATAYRLARTLERSCRRVRKGSSCVRSFRHGVPLRSLRL